MYDVELLEREWRRYKIKQTLPWIGFSFVLSLIAVYLLNREYIFNEIKKFMPKEDNITKVVKVAVIKEPKIKVEKRCLEVNRTEVVEVAKEEVVLKRDVNSSNIKRDIEKPKEKIVKKEESVDSESLETIDDKEYNREIDREIEKIQEKPKMSIEFAEEDRDIEENGDDRPHRRKYLNIIVTDKDSLNEDSSKIFDTLSIVKERYNQSNNYQDALYLAEGYYQQGEYELSQKWALISNNLNSNSEESWLIFAKSKAKLGNYKVAEDILEAYIKENSSKKAEKLLKMMQLGKF
jgi:tetratricopeptide (TPR) repeat protein